MTSHSIDNITVTHPGGETDTLAEVLIAIEHANVIERFTQQEVDNAGFEFTDQDGDDVSLSVINDIIDAYNKAEYGYTFATDEESQKIIDAAEAVVTALELLTVACHEYGSAGFRSALPVVTALRNDLRAAQAIEDKPSYEALRVSAQATNSLSATLASLKERFA